MAAPAPPKKKASSSSLFFPAPKKPVVMPGADGSDPSKRPGVAGSGVAPGSAKSPVPGLKLPGGRDVTVSGNHIGTVNVVALRNFLRSKGYDLPHSTSTVLGRRLLSAMDNWGITKLPARFGSRDAVTALMQKSGWRSNAQSGQQTPKAWSQRYGENRPKVGAPINTILSRGGVPQANPKTTATGTYDPTSLKSAADALGAVPIDEALANQGINIVKDPKALADALAGLQFDPQLRDTAHQQDVNVEQTKQNVHDIGAWYDQALKSRQRAATRDSAISSAGQESIKGADAAIIASLGGDANAGAATVGNAAQASQGTLAALGAAQDMFNADVQPIMQQEQAGQLATERARGTQRAQDLAVQLADLKGQRGATVADKLFQIQQQNADERKQQLQNLLAIKQFNAGQAQQGFQNQLAIDNANLAALTTGAKIAASSSRPAKGTFADTPASVKAQVAQRIFTDLQSAAPKTPQQAQAIVAARLRGAGWSLSNPAVSSYGNALLTNWQQTQQ